MPLQLLVYDPTIVRNSSLLVPLVLGTVRSFALLQYVPPPHDPFTRGVAFGIKLATGGVAFGNNREVANSTHKQNGLERKQSELQYERNRNTHETP